MIINQFKNKTMNFHNDTIRITNEDNMQLMARYPDKHFELAIIDPPYGINVNMNAGRKKEASYKKRDKKQWDNKTPDKFFFDQLFRVSKNQIIWGGNYFELPLTKSWLFWDKHTPKGMSFADGELAWISINTVLRKIDLPYSGFIGNDGEKFHPTTKPIALYKWLLSNYAKAGDKILDTHLGSGSIAIACADLGFDLTGCELDKDYFNAATKRLQIHLNQAQLFAPSELRKLQSENEKLF